VPTILGRYKKPNAVRMRRFVFDINKAVAAAAYVTRKRKGQRISIFELLKTMYAGEREALASWHRPITGDNFCSLPKGVVLSRTYNLIKGEVMGTNSDMVKWSQHFSARDGNCVQLIAEPDYDYLSERERDALDKGAELIRGLIAKHGRIADVLHDLWPEWKNPQGSGKGSIPLTPEEVLGQVIEDDDEAERVAREIESVQTAKAALQRG
jgi:Antitoxin SocA-like, Panacea domain